MKTFKRIYNIVTAVLLVVVLIIAFLLVGMRLFGFHPYTVLSGSMEPTYSVGSVIYVKSVNPNSLKVNDPVTYYMENGTVVTHRIIEVIYNENTGAVSYRTKGDANETPDGGEPLPAGRVIGKPSFSIPYFGYVANYLQSTAGFFLAASVCLIVLLGMFIPEIVSVFFEKPKIPLSDSEPNNGDSESLPTSGKDNEDNDQTV